MTAPGPQTGKRRILVVDDHPFFREGLAAWLDRHGGFECCGFAETVEGARAAITQHQPALVLLDLQLSQGDGIDLLADATQRRDAPPVIVLSQRDETFYAERALRAGARGYVMKNEAAETVLKAIQTVLAGGVYVSPALRQQLIGRFSGTAPKASPITTLSARELRVFTLLGQGLTTKAIAGQLGISAKTAESYRESLKLKLGLPDGVTLLQHATLFAQEGRLPVKADPPTKPAGDE